MFWVLIVRCVCGAVNNDSVNSVRWFLRNQRDHDGGGEVGGDGVAYC